MQIFINFIKSIGTIVKSNEKSNINVIDDSFYICKFKKDMLDIQCLYPILLNIALNDFFSFSARYGKFFPLF